MAKTKKGGKKSNLPSMYPTPAGTARYAYLHKADTKFNENGVYKVDLILPADDAKTVKLTKFLDSQAEKALKKAKKGAKTKAAANKITKHVPYEMEEDDEGEETGNVIVKFKMNRKGKDPKTGATWTRRPKFFDAKGKRMEPVAVFGGSTIKVSYTARDFYNAANKMAGVTLRLQAVKVIDLVKLDGPGADAYGFDEEEEGFSAEDADEFEGDEAEEESDEDDDDEDQEDF